MNTVLITGATSGIGEQLTRDYILSGWTVIACGRNKDKLQELASIDTRVKPLEFDVSDDESVREAFSALPATPQLWLFNAGSCEYIDKGEIDSPLISRVMDVNFTGVVRCVEAAQSYFKPGHRVAFVGSIASEVALTRSEAYGASKAALSYFARSYKNDIAASGVDVSLIFPGFVKTPLTDKNDFAMPMLISVEEASKRIMHGLSKNRDFIYFPRRFTWILRVIGALPYQLQAKITSGLVGSQGEQ
ncbi:SDR family NAD(P)-dependent oxidoreductase [Vibrio astriarenae]|uniref:SDR family NAD(P)-dependent oxidoreductase n=1 Tax=Vibrio astriarenae TaxID=1481923 RepID=UPI003734EEC8